MSIRRIALAVLVAAAAWACDENLSDVAGPTPNLAPTFSSIQREIFNQTDSSGRRACVTCHAGALAPFGLSLADAGPYSWRLEYDGGAGQCRSGVTRLDGGATCTVGVTFTAGQDDRPELSVSTCRAHDGLSSLWILYEHSN